MTGRVKSIQLVADPVVRAFNATQSDAFVEYVAALECDTITTVIQAYTDLTIDDTGARRCDKYRYTHLALGQVCINASAGLMRLVTDISGVTRRVDNYDEVISVATAARIFNACIKLRFMRRDGLYGKQLISNTQHNTIDGMVGSLYKYLPHHHLYEMLTEMFQDRSKPPILHHAKLTGRRLSMSLLHPVTFKAGGYEFSSGFYFANSEAGECSVSAAFIVGLVGKPVRCIGQLHKISHSGKKFSRRLASLLAIALKDNAEYSVLQGMFAGLIKKELDLSNNLNKTLLASELARHGMDIAVAELIVSWTAQQGGEGKVTPTRHNGTASRRTGMDLFMRLITEASNYAPKLRETLEHAAFRLLTGEVVL